MPNVVRKSGEYVYYDDGSVALQTHTDNAPDSNSMNPVDIQSRYAQTIQTHSGVTVGPSGSNSGAWIDTDGFDKIAFNVKNDAAVSSSVTIFWSSDGSAINGGEYDVLLSNYLYKSGAFDTKMRYVRFDLTNKDAAPHVMSAWAYMKA